jgi:hypothetical protein
MSPIDYFLEVLENLFLLKIFFIVYIGILLLNKWLFNKYFNGLLLLTFNSAIVFSVILDLFISKKITSEKLLFFIFSDLFIYLIVLVLYFFFIRYNNKEKTYSTLLFLNNKYFSLFAIWLLISLLINLNNVSWDGSSRIEFQTAQWYSIVRIITQIMTPITGLLVIFNLYERNYLKFSLLFLLVIAMSIATGSKSSFVLFFIEYFLIFRDISVVKFKIRNKTYFTISFILLLFSLFNFILLGVDLNGLFERIVHYAESTIMIFPASNPCKVCQDQSLLSLTHRGFARLFGDKSAVNIDSLFGFALSAEYYGANTFTGPNARIGSYTLCAFPGFKIFVMYFVFVLFISFNLLLIKITSIKYKFLYITSILLFFHGIQQFILDYNTAMSDFTIILFILLFLFIKFIITKSPSLNNPLLN